MADWFAENAPKPAAGNWFEQNAPGRKPPSPPEAPKYYGFTPGNILSNVWRGGKELAQGLGQTAKDVGEFVAVSDNPLESGLVQHIWQPMKAEYGKAREEFAKPDALSKVAGFGHGLAAALPGIGPWAAGLGEHMGTGDIGGALARGATQIAVPAGASKVSGVVRSSLASRAPGMYQSALKPSTTYTPAQVGAIVNTGLREAIPVSRGGLAKLRGTVEDINQRVGSIIDEGQAQGVSIDPRAVARRVEQVRPKFAEQVNPEADIAALEASKQEFLRKHTSEAPYTKIEYRPEVEGGPVQAVPVGRGVVKTQEPIPAAEAQASKVGTYRQLRDKYNELKSADIEGQKALARGLKEELEPHFPEIKPLNLREGQLIELQQPLERALNRIANRDLVGIGTPIAGGVAGALTKSAGVGALTTLVKAALEDPLLKSKLAIALSRARPGGAVNPLLPPVIARQRSQ